jgi:thiamine transporter
MTKTKKLTTSAVLIALSTVLVFASKLIPAPWLQGGSVTLASMVPIILISFINGTKWGILSGFVFSLIQMMTGFYPPPTQNFISFVLVIFLDYIFAFTVLGCADIFKKLTKNKPWSECVSGVVVTSFRYFFHILSGILIWGVYAEEGQTVLSYSVIYNGSYMIPEIIITGVVIALITPVIKKFK